MSKKILNDVDDLSHIFVKEPEIEEGNIEYKYTLTGLSNRQKNHLAIQMKFRLDEGLGEAIYEIGIRDDGYPIGLNTYLMEESLSNLKIIAESISAKICYINRRFIGSKIPPPPDTISHIQKTRDGVVTRVSDFNIDYIESRVKALSNTKNSDKNCSGSSACGSSDLKEIAEILIREDNKIGGYIDIRLAVAGNVDSSKSSTIGVLIKGVLDNGRGSARLNVFNHKHEIESGRTSSIGQQILGFDSNGCIVNEKYKVKAPTWKEIVEQSSKIITFFDLAGHEKYLKTTIIGMSSNNPDYCMIMVGANMGITHITKEHMVLCLSMKVPFFVVMSKIDICPPNILEHTYEKICKLIKLPGIRRIPFLIKSIDDVMLCSKNMVSDNIVPIFQISNVTGENLDLLRVFLNCLPARKDFSTARTESARFQIHETFSVTGVGTVVSGILTHGKVKVGDKMLLGPSRTNKFSSVQIRSIHCKRVNISELNAGYIACFGLKKVSRDSIKKGMVLVDPELKPVPVWEFEAEIMILHSHSTTIKKGYQPIIHINNIRQCAIIKSIDNVVKKKHSPAKPVGRDTKNEVKAHKFHLDALKSGDRAIIHFRFNYHPEWFEIGSRLVFREGKTKGVGVVTKIC